MSIRTNCSFLGRVEALEDRVNLSPPTVTGIVVGDPFYGQFQRSMVTKVAVSFSEHVTFTGNMADAISLNRTSATGEQPGVTGLVNASATVNNTGPGSIVTLMFNTSGSKPVFSAPAGSLPDGRYALGVDASKVSGSDGALDGNGDGIGGDNYSLPSMGTSGVFRLYGDVNGDSFVSASDFVQFRLAVQGQRPEWDYDGDIAIATSDFIQFRLRFGGDLG